MLGRLISLEGCEGVGKSTQLRMLKEYLDHKGILCKMTREPGGSPISEQIRKIILDAGNREMNDICEVMLYMAARAQHLQDIIIPALESGNLVVCDRYVDSTFAYQGYAKGLGEAYVRALNQMAVGKYMPELTLFLDFPPDKAFSRKGGADKNDRLEQLDSSFHRRVYEGYCVLTRTEPERFVAVDASGNRFQTHERIIQVLQSRKII